VLLESYYYLYVPHSHLCIHTVAYCVPTARIPKNSEFVRVSCSLCAANPGDFGLKV